MQILPDRAKKKGEPLTSEEQFALRFEFGELMRIGRISRPGALCGASVSAHTFEAAEVGSLNQSNSDEIVGANLAKATGNIQHNRIKGFGEFMGISQKVRIVLIYSRKYKKKGRWGSKTHFRARTLTYLRKSIKKLKSDGAITIRFPSVACVSDYNV